MFQAALITDVVLGLSYERGSTPSDHPGANAVFRLPLTAC